MRRLAIFSFAFALAALCAGYLPLEGALRPLGAGFGVLTALTWVPLERRRRIRKALRWAAAGLALGFLWTAGYSALFWRPAQVLDDTTIRLHGTVAQWPQETDYGFSVRVRLEPEAGPEILTLLYLDSQGAELRPGDRVETVAHCSLADRHGPTAAWMWSGRSGPLSGTGRPTGPGPWRRAWTGFFHRRWLRWPRLWSRETGRTCPTASIWSCSARA